jgi:phosphoadenosine phosphosulfate reductase
MSLNKLNFDGKNKVEVAIMRLLQFHPLDFLPYYGTFSGGKDSVVIYTLGKLSKMRIEWHFHVTGLEPPELMRLIKTSYPDVIWDRPSTNFWDMFQHNGFPTRTVRWCCRLMKESYGSGHTIVTGIRWQESTQRKNRKMVELCENDNSKRFLNPIIDWTEYEVWEFIRKYNVPYCSLYDEKGTNGKKLFRRLGCILCPMHTPDFTQIELQRFPRYAEAWHRAFLKLWDKHTEGTDKFKSGEAMWQFWLSRKGEPKVNNAQCTMFG